MFIVLTQHVCMRLTSAADSTYSHYINQ